MWDRFDDAMDDINDDIREYKKDAEKLEQKLISMGFTKFKRPEKFHDKTYKKGNYMQEAYTDNVGFWHEWQDYIDFLEKKVAVTKPVFSSVR